MRLFIAIDPPEKIRQQLSELQFPAKNIRWNKTEQLHLTLAFLDEQPQDNLDNICEALSDINLYPFELITQDIGCFRHGAIWLGFQACEPLKQLQHKITHGMQSCGIHMESRRFHPHITLGRCKNPAPVVEQLHHRLDYQTFYFSVDHFVLKSSRLHSNGAKHLIEAEFWIENT